MAAPVASQVSDGVGHVESQATWTDALVACLRPSGHHLSDDELFEILNAGSDAAAAAALLSAKGITRPMYFLWKSKYRHMNREELGKARRQEHWRARVLICLLIGIGLSGGGVIVFGLTRAVQGHSPGAAHAQSAVTPPLQRDSLSEVPEAPGGASISETGYKIQIAAAPTVDQARVLVERLTAAGYEAYLSSAIVSAREVFRVRVGPFETLPAAEKIASQLRRDGYADAWIAP